MQVYKRPESVLVLVFTARGDVLMLRRRIPVDFWQSVTGSLKWGEPALEAAYRELFEETGLSGYPIEDCLQSNKFEILPVLRKRYAPGISSNQEYVFRVEMPTPLPVCLSDAEHSEYRWMPFREAAALTSSWTNRAAILALFPDH